MSSTMQSSNQGMEVYAYIIKFITYFDKYKRIVKQLQDPTRKEATKLLLLTHSLVKAFFYDIQEWSYMRDVALEVVVQWDK